MKKSMGEETVPETQDTQATTNVKESDGENVHTHFAEEPRGRLFAMEEKWKLIYNENQRSPNYSVSHYITYLKRYVDVTNQLRTIVSGKTTERFSRKGLYDRADTKPTSKDTQRSLDSISPMSYFIRKLKLDLKLAFIGFVEEFIQSPSNGLRLLLLLLKNLQVLSASPGGGVLNKEAARGTLKMEEYKKSMIDEQDCLLCIKYSLRASKSAVELLDYSSGLLTVALCVLSNFSRSRITAMEILTVLLSGPSAVDRVLDAFTSMRIMHAESCRFKMLVNMLYTRGVSHVLFQVTCLRMLNTLLNFCKSANMRVYLQYEIEEAGLNLDRMQQSASGDGLEFDDLKREIWEWKMRYVDVDAILRKMKADLRVDAPGSAVTEFNYDQHFGQSSGLHPLTDMPTNRLDEISNMARREDVPYWKAASHDKEAWATGGFTMKAYSVATTETQPGSVISSQPTSSNSDNVTGNEVPAYRGRNREQQPVILSRAASPSNPRPTHALVGGKENAVAVDFDLNGFASVKAELWEPYGMVIGHDPARETQPSSKSANGVAKNTSNWVFGSPPSRNPQHWGRPSSEGDAKSTSSGFSKGESEKSNATRKGGVNEDTSKLFYSPKHSGIDSGPLRWFNPGITVPESANEARSKSDTEGDAARSDKASSKYNRRFGTPSPDYNSTPPPDYNDSDHDDRHESRPQRPSKPPMSSVSTDREGKSNGKVSSQLPTNIAPRNTSTNSNFQRWPPVRRKSFSELTKPNSPTPAASSSPSEESQSPPPLRPPRVNTRNTKTSSTPFFSGHVPEGTKVLQKHNSNKFVRHGESKNITHKNESVLSSTSKSNQAPIQQTPDKIKGNNYDSEGKENISEQSSSQRFALKTSTHQSNKCSNSDYAPGIPSNRSPIANHASILGTDSTSHHLAGFSSAEYPQKTVTSTTNGAQRNPTLSTIIISSTQSSVVQGETKSGNNFQNLITDEKLLQMNYETFIRNADDTVLGEVKATAKNIHVPMAITITSPTPPQSMSDISGGVPNKTRQTTQSSAVVSSENSDGNNQLSRSKRYPDTATNHESLPTANMQKEKIKNINSHDTLQPGNLRRSESNSASPQLSQDLAGNSKSNTSSADQQPVRPESAAHNRQDSVLSYTSEIGRVLGELDHTLETHGWQASLKQQVKKPRPPLVAYV